MGYARTPSVTESSATASLFQTGGRPVVSFGLKAATPRVERVVHHHALLEHFGIEVTAVHSHMLTEQPRLFFLHFWANDDAMKLAKGLRAALDKTASTKS